MNETLKKFFQFYFKVHPLLSLLWIFFALSIIVVLFVLIHNIASNDLKEIFINVVASFLGFVLSFVLFAFLLHLLSKHEDEQKVCYDDRVIFQQYGENYKHKFPIYSGKDFNPGLIKEDIKIDNLSLPTTFYRRMKHYFGRQLLLAKFKFDEWGKKTSDASIDPKNYYARIYADKLFYMEEGMTLAVKDKPDWKDQFELESFIKGRSIDILAAHGRSQVEHSLTVRLNDVKLKGNNVTLFTSRSTYLAHLLTNRAVDYKIKAEISLRELYENRSELTPLSASKFSNHIGVNVLVFLTDSNNVRQYLLLPKRDKVGTIAKGKLTASWATRLKMKDYTGKLLPEYVNGGFLNDIEIFNEFASALGVRSDWLRGQMTGTSDRIRLLGGARDVYEGGKPTFFYVVDLKVDLKDYIEASCRDNNGNTGQKKHIDRSSKIYVAVWRTLYMNQHLQSKDNKIIFYDDRLTFNALNYYRHCIEHVMVSCDCEKNLITAFWFLQGCQDYKS